jgi:hypothetical protein
MSDLFESLKELKTKLNNMEDNYENKTKELLKRNRINEDIDKKLELLVGLQKDKIQVEAGGKIYETTKPTIEKCYFDNILKDKLYKQDFNKPIFIDIGSKDFKLILKIMRYFSNDSEVNNFKLYYETLEEREKLETVLNYFFKSDNKLKELISYYKI